MVLLWQLAELLHQVTHRVVLVVEVLDLMDATVVITVIVERLRHQHTVMLMVVMLLNILKQQIIIYP
jgi:hypothetical protein